MARPESIDDLPDYERRGHQVASIDSSLLARFPSLGLHLLSAINEAKVLGLDVDNEGTITVRPTDDELAQALDRAQRSWDTTADWYAMWLRGEPVEVWKRNTINTWARAEGRTPIDFEGAVAS